MQKALEQKKKIKSFTDLVVWKESHKLVLLIYGITKQYPREETYSLVDQMRRAVTSVTSNIAEGFGRQGYKEKIQFYYIAQGSITELKNQLIISRDLKYLSPDEFKVVAEQANQSHKLLVGLIKKTKELSKS